MTRKLGASLALTGPEAEYGGQLRVAMELALDDSDLGDVELRVEDDGSDPARAATAARRLIGDPDVFAVVGPMNSWTCSVQAPLFAEAGLSQITPSASSPDLAAGGWSTFHRMCPADDLQGDVLAAIAHRLLDADRVAAVHDDTDFGRALAARFGRRAEALGLSPVGETGVGGGTGLDHALRPLVDARPDAVLVVGLEEPCRAVARGLRRLGSEAVLLGTDAIKPTRVLVTGDGVAGPYLTCSTVDARAVTPELHRRIERRHGRHDSIYSVETYDAARLLLEALGNAADPTASPEELRRRLGETLARTDGFQGAGGEVRFDSRGERVNPRIGVYVVRDGDLVRLGDHREVLVLGANVTSHES